MKQRTTFVVAAFALSFGTAIPTSQAEERRARETGPTVSLGTGAVHNIDDYDQEPGTGGAGRLRIAYRTSIGLDPIVTLVPLLLMPSKDAPGGALGVGAKYAVTLGRLEPYAEASVAYLAGDRGGELAHLVGAGIDLMVTKSWSLGAYVNHLSVVDDGIRSVALMEGIELGWHF